MRSFFAPFAVVLALVAGASFARADDFVLALSWTPGFCATLATPDAKPECAPSDASTNALLSLHGLWPQPRGRAYCAVSDDLIARDRSPGWDDLPPVPLQDPALEQALAEVMPGVASHLDRHEWIKHGTCTGWDADTYMRTAIALTQTARATQTQRLISKAQGDTVTSAALCRALEADFGPGILKAASLKVDRVGRGAQRRAVLVDLRIYLRDSGSGLALDSAHLAEGAASLRCTPEPLAVP
ncbi:ribonuclease T2 family protein [Pararhodospirillum oryzae]|uniref:Uncharacterized protein n=1 Tax=Pararhodospirillum oryzae TaxID=478448 RepID=A0A512H4G8_9PROT|nr:hypothetical protein [Pararhodospirillum oryzae]GEO80331.1 hypothetical protein ROR02_04620 [Pararhodospirillum oryzae]